MFCARYMYQVETSTGDKVKPIPCKCWSCEQCQPKRRRGLIREALAGQANKMLTLTITPNIGESPNDRRRMLHHAWVVLRKRMARRLKVKHVPYMAFVEKTEAGEPHLHILLRCKYIHFKWISNQMRQLVKSPVIWINKIKDNKRAAYYVTKYCAKAPAQFLNMKRYWKTRSWCKSSPDDIPFPKARIPGQRRIRTYYSELVEERLQRGWALKPLSDGWVDFMSPQKMVVKPGYVYQTRPERELAISGNRPSEHVEDFASLYKGGGSE